MAYFQHRKLMSDLTNQTSSADYLCGDCYSSCYSSCYKSCPQLCPDSPHPYLNPPPSPGSGSLSHAKGPSKSLIITFTVLATAFLVLCSYVYVRRYRRRYNARRRSSIPETTETRDEFLDEDHGPVVDHPIWYINTVGLQQSIINSIAVCKYKRGGGLVEGTDCSVCWNEFQEDETLRLLPKCSHAFHLPCIDTWLRSHTNCPMCRAPIVSDTANKGPSSSDVNTEDSGGVSEETQVVTMADGGEAERESEIRIRADEEEELGGENERSTGESSGIEDVIQPMRRSVSLDSLEASQISQALLPSGINPEGTNGNSDNELAKGKESSLRIVSRRTAGNQSLLRLMCHSSIGRSLQNRPIFMKRSFSCNGKFSLPICNNKSRNTNPPQRSF
ncbi:hypothetical protein PTKIN_Ptkin10aG0106000 [Pterospermum kingtungense]